MIFFWVTLYGLTYTVSQRLSRLANLQWLPPLVLALYVCLLIIWVFRSGQQRKTGLCPMRCPAPREYADFIPLLLLPAANLLTAQALSLDVRIILLTLSFCAAEEIFFRGFLLHFLTRFGAVPAVIFSSLIFALFHSSNLIIGQDFVYTLAQLLCALSLGICYGAIALRYGSILPCFLSHFLTNITGTVVYTQPYYPTMQLWICIAICGLLGLRICCKIQSDSSST